MALTNIPNYKTPSRPIEITFDSNFAQPDSIQTIMILGHFDVDTPITTLPYTEYIITNISSVPNVTAEVTALFGATAEISLMIIAAVTANVGSSSFPLIKAMGLEEADTDIPQAAKDVLDVTTYNFLVSPYDADDTASRDELKTIVQAVSAADRTDMFQFGAFGMMFNRSVTDFTTLDTPDTQYLGLSILRDTGIDDDAPALSAAEICAMYSAKVASRLFPFNPLNGEIINGIVPPKKMSDWITVSGTGDSEVILRKGWTPLGVFPSGTVYITRSVTTRITDNGSALNPEVGEPYVDIQDFQVLYFLRKTLHARFSRSDFKQSKASNDTAIRIKGEVIKILKSFEDQGAVQNVDELSKKVKVERNISYRSRYDIFAPVNVIPGLHQVGTNIQATTEGDLLLLTI